MRSHLLLMLTMALIAVEEPEVPAQLPATVAAVRQAYLGLAIDGAATSFAGHGLVALRVEPGSPAAVMGLAAGDRLTHLDGQALVTEQHLQRALADKRPGDRITITALRAQGSDGSPVPLECSGILQELPRTRTASLGSQLSELQTRLAELEDQTKEPTLGEILERLHDIERDLPKAAAAFKLVYPDGEFRIAISVEVTSHKSAPNPLAIEVGGRITEAGADSVVTPRPQP